MQLPMGLRLHPLVRRLRPLACSFCGRSEHDVRALASGAHAFICDACTQACATIFRGGENTPCDPIHPSR